MRPKLQRIGYLSWVFNMRLNRLIKSQLRVFYGSLSGFRTSFNILSIFGANCLSSVCWVPHRTLHLQFDSQVRTSDHFDSGFERFSHQFLAFVYYSENSRFRLFKVIIKLLCAHCFSSLGISFFLDNQVGKILPICLQVYFGFWRSIFETPFLMNSSVFLLPTRLPRSSYLFFLSFSRCLSWEL